jgi:guanylate kinase
MDKKGILIVVSGFSGAGKGTLMKHLIREYGEHYALSISATTRPPRKGEEHGREYFFVSESEFEAMIEQGELIEYAKYVDHYYGTPKKYVEEQLEQGLDVILEIEIQGGHKVKKLRPDSILLFVSTPNASELERRLLKRGTEDEDRIRSRLERATEEAEGMVDYDYMVINDDLVVCANAIHGIVQSEHMRVARNYETMVAIKEELKNYVTSILHRFNESR